MTKTENITEAVRRGIVLLNEKNPGWLDDIDIKDLDLASSCYCVLGQLYNGFIRGAYTLFNGEGNFVEYGRYGFEYNSNYDYLNNQKAELDEWGDSAWDWGYPELEAVWKRELLALKASSAQ